MAYSTPFGFDLINWLDGAIACLVYGTHEFRFDYRSTWTGYEVESLLRQAGIYVYGRMYEENRPSEEEYGFKVAMNQAVWAEYLFFRAHVPITSPTLYPPNEKAKLGEASLPPGMWGRKAKGIGKIMNGLAVVAGVPVGSHNHELPTRARKSKPKSKPKSKRSVSRKPLSILDRVDKFLDN